MLAGLAPSLGPNIEGLNKGLNAALYFVKIYFVMSRVYEQVISGQLFNVSNSLAFFYFVLRHKHSMPR